MPAETDEELELSILMPCLDEEKTLGACIEKAKRSLRELDVRGEVIVSDNGSIDGSAAIACASGARVVHAERKGYGSALSAGIEAARGRFVIIGDADQSYDFGALGPFLEKLREGYDLVMGNRFQGRILPEAMPPLHRYIGNPVLSGIGRVLFRVPVGDFHCGLRGFRRSAALQMKLQTTGMEFASEMVVKATLLGLRITEVPITLYPDGRGRESHLRAFRDGWRHLRFLLLYSPRWLFFYPGVALLLTGLLLGAWILPAPRTVGGVTLDVHSLAYAAAAVLLGYQSMAFAVFTKVFAIQEGLLAEDPRLNRLSRYVTLETGLAVGFSLVLIGLAGSIWALGDWGARSFGELDPRRMLRIIIPASLALTLGLSIVLSSFFLSVLGLGRHRGGLS
ncbi:MAG TPA: glycosyltransferase family 2 protein [Vicinamibacteria bacterium]